MIFGSRDSELVHWHKVYVIFPRRLMDGRWVFMQEVYRCKYMAGHIPVHARFSLFGWCYEEAGD